MKKYIILSMTFLFLLSFAACGDKTTGENDTTTEKASAQASDTTTVYDDGFGEIVDGTETGDTSKENVSTKPDSSSTKKSDTTGASESNGTKTTTSATVKTTTAKTTTTKSSNSKNPTEKTSESNSGGLVVGEFDGGDSDDFGELFD